jgi:hypothetical protein
VVVAVEDLLVMVLVVLVDLEEQGIGNTIHYEYKKGKYKLHTFN